jgi:CheY-like chemotaxis protein
VYGIVKQTKGYIWVESELGKGTSFEIYFPRTETRRDAEGSDRGQPAPSAAPETNGGPEASAAGRNRGAGETILLVEDELVIRSLVRNVLVTSGYAVIEAEDGERALEIFGARAAEIDMVVTDVVLPGAGGRDIVEKMSAARPGLPTLFMSGYTREVIDSHGALSPGLAFLQKPFSPDLLLSKVRELLDAPRPAD